MAVELSACHDEPRSCRSLARHQDRQRIQARRFCWEERADLLGRISGPSNIISAGSPSLGKSPVSWYGKASGAAVFASFPYLTR